MPNMANMLNATELYTLIQLMVNFMLCEFHLNLKKQPRVVKYRRQFHKFFNSALSSADEEIEPVGLSKLELHSKRQSTVGIRNEPSVN